MSILRSAARSEVLAEALRPLRIIVGLCALAMVGSILAVLVDLPSAMTASSQLEPWLHVCGAATSFLIVVVSMSAARTIRGLVGRLQAFHSEQQAMIDRLATLQAAAESADTGIVVCDPAGTTQWSNPAVARMTGRSPAEIDGCRIDEFLADPPKERIANTTTTTGRADVRLVRKDGVERTVERSVTCVLGPGGEVVHRVVFLTDVTESRTQAESLRRTLIENAMILDSITSMLIVVDTNLRIRTWNRHAEQVVHRASAELAGRRIDELGLDFMSGVLRQPIESVLRDKQSLRVDDVAFERDAGERRCLAFTIGPLISREGVVHGCLLVGRDLTDMRNMQEQLTQAHKLESIGQLAAGIAHEINTPTQFVSDNTRFVQSSFRELDELLSACRAIAADDRGSNASDPLEDLRAIVKKTDLEFLLAEIPKALDDNLVGLSRVAKIVGAMKQFSHMGTGSKEQVDLNSAIQNTCTVARNEWKYVADVVFDLQHDLPHVPCLPAEMSQVFLNIVVNAAHAIQGPGDTAPTTKGTITISTRDVDGWVEIRISDTGSGIPEAIRRRIYDPFFTTKGVGKGTGQGLAIARSIVVDRHNGTITCESEVGKGTTFVLRLPLEETHRLAVLGASS